MTRRRSPGQGGPVHTVIDGYNAIFRDPELRALARTDLERARDALVQNIARSLHARAGRITVVFDGREGGSGPLRTRGRAGVHVVFSSPPETADQRIQKLVESGRPNAGAKGNASPCRVVSSDREVLERARLWGADVQTVEDFLGALRSLPTDKPRSRPRTMSRQELEEWERLFGRRDRAAGESGEEEAGS